jgi:pimeloyl-ACP methyl ester carboxylesterase
MQPYPGLAHWSRQVLLPLSEANLYFYDTGGESKTPVLFIHGLGDEADTWRHILPLVDVSYRAIAPDLPGFGRSENTKGSYTIPFFANTLLELLDQLSIQRAVLVGHSAGAVIAHTIALEHPERVERLILIGGSLVSKDTRIDPVLFLFLIPGLGEWAYNRLRKDPRAAYRSLEPYYNRLEELPQADRDFLYQRVNERVWSDRQRQAFLSMLRGMVPWILSKQKGLPDWLRGSNVPAQVIWGENDRVNPIANGRSLVDLLPGARMVTVPRAGHNIQQEKAVVVVEALRN